MFDDKNDWLVLHHYTITDNTTPHLYFNAIFRIFAFPIKMMMRFGYIFPYPLVLFVTLLKGGQRCKNDSMEHITN